MSAVRAPGARRYAPSEPRALAPGEKTALLVRAHAQLEAARRRTGGVVEFRSIARRTALYELIARELESPGRGEPNRAALADLGSLIAERPPSSDAGEAARARDRRIAAILVGLERDG